ncbi:MAG: hypothetical protein P1U90_10390 [Akkermansiaceae bacterium]|nr:hypothetical protein [Akkermansiaceae bacterium]
MTNELRVALGQAQLHLLITKSAVRDDFTKLSPDVFLSGFQRAKKKPGVGADVFKKRPMDDEPIAVFSEEQWVAVFNFGPAFPSYENFRTGFIDTENLLLVGDAAFSDDALMGVFDCLQEEGQNVIDATDDLSGLSDAEGRFCGAMFYQQITAGEGVATHAPGEVFHFAQDFLALGFAVLATAGITECDDELVEIMEELACPTTGHAVFDAVFTDA